MRESDADKLYEIAVRETAKSLTLQVAQGKATVLIDALLAQISEAYDDWSVDGGDVRDWIGQIEAIKEQLNG